MLSFPFSFHLSLILFLTFSNHPICFTFFPSHVFLFVFPSDLSSFLLSHPPPFFAPSSSPHCSSRLSPSFFRNSFALPRSSILSFVFLALWPLSFPLPPPHFIENVWYAGAFLYRNGASAAAVRPNGRQGATREATRKDFREPHKGPRRDVAFNLQPRFWDSRACTNPGPLSRRKRMKCSHGDYSIVKVGPSLIRRLYLRYHVHS